MAGPGTHVVFGGSSAYIWTACAASVGLSEKAPPEEPNRYSQRGTAAHALAEEAFKAGVRCEEFIDYEIEGVIIDDELASAAQVYVDWLNNMNVAGATVLLEQPVDLKKLNPPEPMRGTADAVILLPALRRLVVADYKNGFGIVEHVGNKQMRYYALGVLLEQPKEVLKGIDTVQMTIIQPNAQHPEGPIRSDTIGIEELIDFGQDLIDAQLAARAPNPPATPGDHCKWCKGRDICHARAQGAVVAVTEAETALVDPEVLSPEQTAATLAMIEPRLEAVEAWVKAARLRLEREVRAGRDDLGYKLVPKRASRVWSDQSRLIEWAKAAGYGDEIYTQELRSPAQLEKAIGKKQVPADLISTVSSGENLVRDSDPRPSSRLKAIDEFTADL